MKDRLEYIMDKEYNFQSPKPKVFEVMCGTGRIYEKLSLYFDEAEMLDVCDNLFKKVKKSLVNFH